MTCDGVMTCDGMVPNTGCMWQYALVVLGTMGNVSVDVKQGLFVGERRLSMPLVQNYPGLDIVKGLACGEV